MELYNTNTTALDLATTKLAVDVNRAHTHGLMSKTSVATTKEETKFDKILNESVGIVEGYRQYLIHKYTQDTETTIQGVTRHCEVQKIIDKHIYAFHEDIHDLFNSDVKENKTVFTVNSIWGTGIKLDVNNYLTEKETNEISKLKNKLNEQLTLVDSYVDRLIKSLHLCEEVCDIYHVLISSGFMVNGIIQDYQDIELQRIK